MNMRMMLQVLSPCMENAQESDLGPEVTRVCRNLQERRRAGTEQQIVKNAFILLSEGSKLVRDCEDNMRIRDGQKLLRPFCKPTIAGARLTPWTLSVAA